MRDVRMIKVISVPLIIETKVGKNKWRRSKHMAEAEFVVNIRTRFSRIGKAYVFFVVAWKSLILAVRQLFE